MGERLPVQKAAAKAVKYALKVGAEMEQEPKPAVTAGGRMQVRWDTKAKATAMGQLVFFAEFLDVAKVFERWVASCPLTYTSGNAPQVRDVLGTWMLSILDGHCRYSHIAGLRGDTVAPAILGMQKILSDESLRRALTLIAPAPKSGHDETQTLAQQAQVERAQSWMKAALLDSVQGALDTPWILDCDPTVKPLYGKQSGAEIGYNPRKPGRPSHTVHTYWISALRLVIGAELQSGKSSSAKHSLPGLLDILTRLPPHQRPQLVRSDCAFGNETIMRELEQIEQPYLFKLKQSANVKRLVEKQWRQGCWMDVGQGWQAREDRLQLMGWSTSRRVIVMRHEIRGELLVETAGKKRGKKSTVQAMSKSPQQCLALIDRNDTLKIWEYAVLVTNSRYATAAMGQLYRDRADCENGFDELKNQWGWGGFSTQDIERCNLSAQAVALVYNWWSWYCRLAHPKARLEAISSRPLLLAAVGKVTEHAGQKRLLLSITHAAASHVKALVANVQAGLELIRSTTPQFTDSARWQALVRFISNKIMAATIEKSSHANAPPAIPA